MSYSYFAKWEDFPEVEYLPGIKRHTISGEKVTVTRVTYAPGTVIPNHQHEAEQVTIVVQGRLLVRVADIEKEVGPGEVVVTPSNVAHSLKSVGNEQVIFFEAFHPIRLDYLIGFVGRDVRDQMKPVGGG
jgi:quercetin dioxygenase-like cupin family protein